jgi:hypothetical protein
MDDENDFIDMPAPRRSAPQTNPTNATNARPQFSRRQRVHHTPRDVVNLPIQPVRLHDPRTTIQRLELKIDLLDGNPSNEPLRDVDATILLDDLNKLEAFWMKLPSVQSRDQFLNTVLQRFNISPTQDLSRIDLVQLQSHYNAQIFTVCRLSTTLGLKNLLSSDEPHKGVSDRILRLMHIIDYQYKMIVNFVMNHKLMDPSYPLDNLTLSPFMEGPQSMDRFPKLILFLRQRAAQFNYRRKGGSVYKEIRTPGGHRSRAWKRECSLEVFVRQQTDTSDQVLFNLATLHNNYKKHAAEELENGEYPDFPVLVPNRHIHSFLDGIYDVKNHKFYDYVHDLPPFDLVSTKYHPCQFKPEWATEVPEEIRSKTGIEGLRAEVEWINKLIPTPHLDEIFKAQHITDAELDRACFKALAIGKMLYAQCEIENWQIFFVLIGKAGTGKSSMGLIIKQFYNFEDIGLISSNQRADFGAQDLADKHIWLCFELKENFQGVATCDLQSMASAEPLSLNVKFKSNLVIEQWRPSFMFFGNELSSKWNDNAGNFHRRIICGYFNYKVEKQDPDLQQKIQSEIGAIIAQTNLMFRCWVRRYGHGKIENYLTPYFKKTHEYIKMTLNPIRSFLKNEKRLITGGTGYYMPDKCFWKLLQSYCQTYNLPPVNKNTQQLGDVFDEEGIAIIEKTESRPFVIEACYLSQSSSDITKIQNCTDKFYVGIGLRIVDESPYRYLYMGQTPNDMIKNTPTPSVPLPATAPTSSSSSVSASSPSVATI